MSLCHVRVVTSDRVIHHFTSLADAEQFRKLPLSVREPSPADEAKPMPHGHRRHEVMSLIAERPGISTPEIAGVLDASDPAINTILRRLVACGFVVAEAEARSKRRSFRITPLGLEALKSTTKDKA